MVNKYNNNQGSDYYVDVLSITVTCLSINNNNTKYQEVITIKCKYV